MFKFFLFLVSLIPFISPTPVFAHAFGQIYTLPLPVWLYLYGGGAAVIVSFLVIGWFINKSKGDLTYPILDLSKYKVFNFVKSKRLKFILQAISIFIFIITIIAGFIGSQLSSDNLAPLIFWIFLLLGVTYLSAFIGNIWEVVNPFKIISSAILRLTGGESESITTYPAKLGFTPAFIFYFILIWLELLSGGMGSQPSTLSIILLTYTFITVIGSYLYGLKDWFKYGEFFSVFFGLISKMAPFEFRENKFYLRPPFVGLTKGSPRNYTLLFFILFMLSSTAFDGFRATSAWFRFNLDFLGPLETRLGDGSYRLMQTILLFLAPVLFLLIYLTAIILMKLITRIKLSIGELALKFAFSLLPIALAYNIAHYYTLIFTSGQSIITLISDPFNLGWNLFGTSDFYPNIGILGANFIWHSQLVVIIVGHIAAVYLSHLLSLSIFPSHKKAIISQLPMLLLMVFYTMAGLWILSQPISGGG